MTIKPALQADVPKAQVVRIVVADGEDRVRNAICPMLGADRDHEVEQASSLEALMEMLREPWVDCIVLGNGFGPVSSFEILSRIRKDCGDPPAVILVADGGGLGQTILKAFRHGFSDFVRIETLSQRELTGAVTRAVERRRIELHRTSELEQLALLALRDRLTGLPSRQFLEERLSLLASGSERYGTPFAVIRISIAGFDSIVARLGIAVADKALQAFADRLKQVSRASDIVGRFDGCEFMYLTDRDVSAETIDGATARLTEALTFSIELDHVGLSLSPVMRAEIYPRDGQSATELLDATRFSPLPTGTVDEEDRPAAEPDGPPGVHRQEDRRAERRNRVLKRGTIVMNDGYATLECTIRDLSDSGARITVQEGYSAPRDFSLRIAETGAVHTAERRWQRGRDIGLRLRS